MFPFCLGCDDARVGLGLSDRVFGQILGVHGDPLLFVVRAPVSDDDLGGILVRHHDGWLGQSVPEAQRVVGFQRFLHHASVKVPTALERSSKFQFSLHDS